MKRTGLKALGVLIAPYRWWMLLLLSASLAVSLLEGLHVAAFFPVFQTLLGEKAGAPVGLLQWMTDWVAGLPLRDPIAGATLFLLAITVLRCLMILAYDALLARVSGHVHDDLKNRLMHRLAGSAYSFFLDHKQGELLYTLYFGTSRVGTLTQKVSKLVSEALMVSGIAVLLFISMREATVLLALMGLVYYGLTRRLSSKISYHVGRMRVASGAEQTSIANEFLTGIRQIMAFGTQPAWLGSFRRESTRFRDLYVKDSIWLSIPKVLLEFFVISFLVGVVLLLRIRNPGFLSSHLALFALFAVGVMRILPSLSLLGHLMMEISGLIPDAEAVHRLLTQPLPAHRGGSRPFRPMRREIALEGVHFGYPGREPLFQGLQTTFPRGKVTGIVGTSGSGKSTLAHLLLGLLEPARGRILVDGVELREYPLEEWRKRIGFVSQEMFAFHASIADNIRFGRKGYPDERVRRAAELAKAHSFIQELPHGYETVVGERGMKISGGQQQRIAIARAALHDPEILIFDEATSFLDTESERLVQEAIESVSRERTVILIAHRLSTVRNADQILVMERGRIAEEGTHEELLRFTGIYHRLVASAGLQAEPQVAEGTR